MAARKRTDPIPFELVDRIAGSLSPEIALMPPAQLRSSILKRIAQDAEGTGEARITTIREDGEGWTPFSDGVAAKVLNDDGRVRTWLARMERGARLPAHAHDGDEECLVLEGSVLLGDVHMRKGDYQIARTGTRHGEISSPAGCLLLLRSPSPQPA